MKPSKVFWGSFFITFGILLLILNFEKLDNAFNFVWYIWPLVFVFWGISLLKVSQLIKQLLAAGAGIIIALTLVGGFGSGYKYVNHSDEFWDEEFSKFDKNSNLSVGDSILCSKYDPSYDTTTLCLGAAAGIFRIKDTTVSWIDIVSNDFSSNILKCDTTDKHIKINLIDNYNFVDDGFKREAIIKLHPQPFWNIAIDLGAVLFDCDLREFKVRNLDIETGASKIKISLGDKCDSSVLNISSGLASIDIRIPKSSGCIISTETGLTKKNFPDFIRIDSKTYSTSNFESARKKIIINISSGLSTFSIKRY